MKEKIIDEIAFILGNPTYGICAIIILALVICPIIIHLRNKIKDTFEKILNFFGIYLN